MSGTDDGRRLFIGRNSNSQLRFLQSVVQSSCESYDFEGWQKNPLQGQGLKSFSSYSALTEILFRISTFEYRAMMFFLFKKAVSGATDDKHSNPF